MTRYSILTDVLQDNAQQKVRGVTFITSAQKERFVSYAELHDLAMSMLKVLQDAGVKPGNELVFQIDDNEIFVIIFWACILGGIIPVPLSLGKSDEHKQKLFRIWPILNQPYLITSTEHFDRLQKFSGKTTLNSVFEKIQRNLLLIENLNPSQQHGQVYSSKENDIAFIQFSSGSTGEPKGVVLTHNNLLVNMNAIGKAAAYSAADTTLSWMPLTHDMGLIGFHLNPMLYQMSQCLIPTDLFIRRPSIWLDSATHHKATVLCSPNFGYGYLLKYHRSGEKYDWDLSNVRLIYNGAEPISLKLGQEFLQTFSLYGIRKTTMCPVYGLAEASLAVSISGLEDDIISVTLKRNQINIGDSVKFCPVGEDTISFVNVGKPIDQCHVRVTDAQGKEIGNSIIGNIEIKGGNVTSGYYNNQEATNKILAEHGWVKTGDLGFFSEGSLFITGRAKDIIFAHGQNYYPHDIERVAEEIDGVELNKIAVAGYVSDQGELEETVAFVMFRGKLIDFVPIALSIKRLINHKMGLELSQVLPIRNMPKTTSGKLQRFKLVEKLRNGDFKEVEEELDQLYGDTMSRHNIGEGVGDDLLEVFSNVFKNSNLDLQRTFLENGGNSMKAAAVSMELLKNHKLDISFELLFGHLSLESVLNEIKELGETSYSDIPKLGPINRCMLSASQRGLYYLWSTSKDSVAYNTPFAFSIRNKKLDVKKLNKVVNELVARHSILRATFHYESEPYFVVDKHLEIQANEICCEPLELDATIKSLVMPFDLSKGPLCRVTILNSGDNQQLLFVDFHHIVSDGTSVENFILELIQLYSGESGPESPVRYEDYVMWEDQFLKSQKIKTEEEFWVNELGGGLPVLDLPLDFPRPPIFVSEGSKLFFDLDPETTRNLERLALTHNATLHTLVFTLYHLLLSKFSGQKEIAIGIPIAGRKHPDVQKSQGMFVNNLAIRATTESDESFVQLLKRQNEKILEALNNRNFPFENLVKMLEGNRDMSRNPIFDTMFIFQSMESLEFANEDLALTPHFFDPGFSKFDISMECFYNHSNLRFGIEYCNHLFHGETINGMVLGFKNLVNLVLDNPTTSVANLSVISRQEQEEYLLHYNQTEKEYPKEKSIHQLFEEQVVRTPDAIALEQGGVALSYQELNEQSSNLAGLLHKNGVREGNKVALRLSRSCEFIVSVFGILKVGACYIPIDTELPEDRLNYILRDSGCTSLIQSTDRKIDFQLVKEGNIGLSYILHIDECDLTQKSSYEHKSINNTTTLAYVIYTSGSTGHPKGVAVNHQSLVNYITWASNTYLSGEKETFPLFTSTAFDISVTSIFTPLITGNKIIIYTDEPMDLPINSVLRDNRVDIMKLTPSHLRIMLDNDLLIGSEDIKCKKIVVGGEQLDTKVAQNIYDQLNGEVEIFNEYGPTEATVGCTIHRFVPGGRQHAVSIGRPISNVKVYILDESLSPVANNVVGKLFVAGDCLATGYINNDSLTDDKFIPNPFVPETRMYDTGDLVRRHQDGDIQFIGREDNQVKIDGYRIELEEIEHQLSEYSEVEEVVVRARTREDDKPYLCAYYTMDTELESAIEESVLQDFLGLRLPYYMIPVRFIRLAYVPLTENGKVDHNSLPEPTLKKSGDASSPESDFEKTSLDIWKDVLSADNLTIEDNFFEFGGDSIKAVQITSRLYERGISLNVRDILIYRTIRQIGINAETSLVANQYEQGLITGTTNLLPIHFWFFNQNFRKPGHYHQSVLLTLKREVNVSQLETAFETLIRQHDTLRINYNTKTGKLFYNEIHSDKKFVIQKHDENVSGRSCSSFFESLKSDTNLESDLLIKAAIVMGQGATAKLFLTIHHLIVDGISWRILLEDLYNTYSNFEKEGTFSLPEKTASLIDWNQALHNQFHDSIAETEKEYWQNIESTSFVLPTDFETSDWVSANSNKAVATLDGEYTRVLLTEIYKAYKVDVPIILNLAILLAFREWTDQDTMIIEQESHGRELDEVDTSRTLGWFTALYPVKIELEGADLEQHIKGVKEQMRSIPQNGIGYGIYKYLSNPEDIQVQGTAQVRVNYLGQFDQELNNSLFSFNHESTGMESDTSNNMTAIWELNALVVDGVFRIELSYNRKAHETATVQRFVDSTQEFLMDILDHIIEEEGVHFTPSDFSAVDLDEGDLETIFE